MLDVTYSRNDLYEQYKKTKPQLAEKFLGNKYSASVLPYMGGASLASAIIVAIMLIGIIGGVTQGFGPTPLNPTFYLTMFSITAGTCGPFAVAGLVMLAVWYCKRRNIRAEKLSVQEINGIAGKLLIDTTAGTMSI